MIIKKTDNLGRLVIPKEMCRQIGVDVGSALEINLKKDTITINKHYKNTLDELQCAIQKVEDPQLRCKLWDVFDNYKKKSD